MTQTSSRNRRTVRLAIFLAFAGAGLWVSRDFLIPLGWAVVLVVAFWPLYTRLVAWGLFGAGAILPPLIVTLVIGLVVLIPLGFAAVEVGREGQAAFEWLRRVQETGIAEPAWLEQLPLVGSRAGEWWREHLAQPQQAYELFTTIDTTSLAGWTKAFGTDLLNRAFVFLITMLALFYLFRNGFWLGDRLLHHASDVLGDTGEQFVERLVMAARGTFNGMVVVAFGEGVLIGLGYVVTGVSRPLLFTAVTIGLAMLPFGAWFAFVVAALLLLSQGGFVLAGLLFGWGALVMVIGDNVIQPALVGGSVRLPFLWTLIGIYGGVETFGLLGLFVGPVIMAGLVTISREWLDRPQLRPGNRLPC
jgi:predicted PurR-regulated permease PerM